MSLTHGAVATMTRSQGHASNPAFQPVLQLINVKAVQTPGGGGNDRFRAVLSDGTHYVQGMLATQLNPLVHSQQLRENTLVQVEDFMNNQVQGRTVIILLKLTVINVDPGQRFGQPTDIEKADASVTRGIIPPVVPQPMYNRTNQTGLPNTMMPSTSYPIKPDTHTISSSSGSSNPYGGVRPGTQVSSSAAPIVRTTTTGTPLTPISQLNMYQNRWTIRARVTSKSDIRTWSNAKGEGSLFSVELLDSSGTDIRGTFFKDAVTKFHPMLQVEQVYTFSGGRLKVANMQWNTCKSSFEITFDQNAEIHLDNDTGDIQQQCYDFTKIAQLEHAEAGKNVDILGIVKHVGEPATLVSKKSGQELTKCDLILVDETGVEISLTVWGDRATQAPREFAGAPVVAFRHAKVSDYGGKSLSASASGAVVVNPTIPESYSLQQWWNSGGKQNTTTRSLSSSSGGGGKMENLFDRKSISDIKTEQMGYGNPDKPDFICFKATVSFLKKDKEGGAWYTACANSGEPCKNRFKVTQTTDGNWYCDKCQGTFPNCVRRWIFSGTVSDDTSTTWVSFFNEQAEILFAGSTADDVYMKTMEQNQDQDAYDSYFAKAAYTDWVFKCKVKQEMVGEESRVKTSVLAMQPVDYVKECQDLLTAIAKF